MEFIAPNVQSIQRHLDALVELFHSLIPLHQPKSTQGNLDTLVELCHRLIPLHQLKSDMISSQH